jgi:hypothetical protein
LPHDPIERLGDGLWRVEAPVPNIALKRVMTLARLDDGRLVIHSAVPLDEASIAEIEAWGRPAFLIVPSRYHRLDAPAYKRRYPDLCVLCPRGARAIVERVVAVDGDYDAFPAAQRVRLKHLEGTAAREGVMIVEQGSKTTLVFNDVIFHMPHVSGVSGFVLRYITGSSGGPRTSRIARTFIVADKAKLAAEFLQLAETPRLERIIVAHHRVISDDPAGVLRALARAL